jgi:hypothetical protein
MIKLEKLLKKPKVFKRLTGLSPDRFQKLVTELEPTFLKARKKRLFKSRRQRKFGGGRKPKLSISESLFMLLLYYRTYVPHIFLGPLMGIDECNVCRYFRQIEPLLARIFRVPERKIDISQEEILELILDATEQETQKRPGSGWSGKKKRNTIKTQIIVNPKGKIKSVSKSIKGSVHDKKLYDKTRVFTTIKEVKTRADLGYVGTSCETPIKKQPNKELIKRQKQYNRQFNQSRHPVERTFAHLKNFKILANKFRNSLNNYNLVFKNIAGIYNYQLA